jgi:hypothetical protein
VDLIAQVLLSGTATDTPAPKDNCNEQEGTETLVPKGIGGVDGTRTRDLRRDRRKE